MAQYDKEIMQFDRDVFQHMQRQHEIGEQLGAALRKQIEAEEERKREGRRSLACVAVQIVFVVYPRPRWRLSCPSARCDAPVVHRRRGRRWIAWLL